MKRTVFEVSSHLIDPRLTPYIAMKTALEKLGYDGVYHMVSCMQNPRDSALWRDAFLYKYHGIGRPFTREDWDHILGDSQVNHIPNITLTDVIYCPHYPDPH